MAPTPRMDADDLDEEIDLGEFSHWNYRVVIDPTAKMDEGGPSWTIREVHYGTDDEPKAWSAGAVMPVGENYDELMRDYLRIAAAFSKPALRLEPDPWKLVEVPDERA